MCAEADPPAFQTSEVGITGNFFQNHELFKLSFILSCPPQFSFSLHQPVVWSASARPPLSSSLDLFSINVSYSFLRRLTARGSAAITHNQALISVC